MPKVGMEPLRRKALIDATISAIGERGSLDVTMSEIAGRAGVSSALAHHYFGAKDELLLATMRHILAELTIDMRRALRSAATPRERVSAVVAVNFSDIQFQPRNHRRLACLLCRGAEIVGPAPAAQGLCAAAAFQPDERPDRHPARARGRPRRRKRPRR